MISAPELIDLHRTTLMKNLSFELPLMSTEFDEQESGLASEGTITDASPIFDKHSLQFLTPVSSPDHPAIPTHVTLHHLKENEENKRALQSMCETLQKIQRDVADLRGCLAQKDVLIQSLTKTVAAQNEHIRRVESSTSQCLQTLYDGMKRRQLEGLVELFQCSKELTDTLERKPALISLPRLQS